MGCDPDSLTGGVKLEAGRDTFARAWGIPVPTRPGMNLMQMIDGAVEGKLKALWVIGYDIARTNPNAAKTLQALESLELLILQDMFLNGVADFANVFLPASSTFEKDGTFMNSERRVQRVRKALDPPGDSKPDWKIICDVARAMRHGRHFDYAGPGEIWDEIRNVWPAVRGMTYTRLEHGGLQWPCPYEDHPDTPILHQHSFPGMTRAVLHPIDFDETRERTSDEFPFLLNTGRALYPFNSGTMTSRSRAAALRPEDLLDISPDDARRLGVRSGDLVSVRSRRGETTLTARVSANVRESEVFATFHEPQALINQVTDDTGDPVTGTPSYKVAAVTIHRKMA